MWWWGGEACNFPYLKSQLWVFFSHSKRLNSQWDFLIWISTETSSSGTHTYDSIAKDAAKWPVPCTAPESTSLFLLYSIFTKVISSPKCFPQTKHRKSIATLSLFSSNMFIWAIFQCSSYNSPILTFHSRIRHATHTGWKHLVPLVRRRFN